MTPRDYIISSFCGKSFERGRPLECPVRSMVIIVVLPLTQLLIERQLSGQKCPVKLPCEPECIEKRLRLTYRHIHHLREQFCDDVCGLCRGDFSDCQRKYCGTREPDGFALQNTPPDAFISSENDPSSFAAGCQPDFVLRAKGKCPAGMLDPRPSFTHALEQQARMNRLVEIKDSVIKPLRDE